MDIKIVLSRGVDEEGTKAAKTGKHSAWLRRSCQSISPTGFGIASKSLAKHSSITKLIKTHRTCVRTHREGHIAEQKGVSSHFTDLRW